MNHTVIVTPLLYGQNFHFDNFTSLSDQISTGSLHHSPLPRVKTPNPGASDPLNHSGSNPLPPGRPAGSRPPGGVPRPSPADGAGHPNPDNGQAAGSPEPQHHMGSQQTLRVVGGWGGPLPEFP